MTKRIVAVRRWRPGAWGLVAVVLLALFGGRPEPVFAHASYVRSDPGPDTVVPTSPQRATVWFAETMAPTASSVEVLNSLGARVDLNDSRVDASDATQMSVSLPALPDGTYTVVWRNVSTVDGHGLQGSFVFFVGARPPNATSSAAAEPPLLQSAADPPTRWLTFIGVLTALGALVFVPVVWRPAIEANPSNELVRADETVRRRVSRLVWYGLAAGLIGSLGQLMVQGAITANVSVVRVRPGDLSAVFETDWGLRWLLRAGCLIGAAAVLAPQARLRGRRSPVAGAFERYGTLAAGLLLVGVLASIGLSSHGAAVASLEVAGAVNDIAHLGAAAVWVGGLLSLALALPALLLAPSRERREVLVRVAARFSLFAGLSVGILLVTGLYSSWLQVTSRRALDTPYGDALTLKLVTVAGVLAFAALNLLWVWPRLRSDSAGTWLRRFVTAEAVLAVAVIVAAAWMTSLEPARQTQAREDQRSALSFGETVQGTRIEGAIGPGTVGTNRVVVELADRGGDGVADATKVLVRLRYLDRDLSPIELTAVSSGGGRYEPPPAVLSIAGAWQVEVEISRPGAFDARTASRFILNPVSGAPGATPSLTPRSDDGRTYWSWVVIASGGLILVLLPRAWSRRVPRARARVIGTGVVLAGVMLFYGAHTHVVPTNALMLTNPFPPDNASVDIGRTLYQQQCVRCHGPLGQGDGPDARGLQPPPADLNTHVPLHTDGTIFYFITNGFPGTAMPAFASSLTDEERWHLVNYLRTLAEPLPDR